MPFFTTLDNLFNYHENTFSNLYQKKYPMEKFSELKMRSSLLSEFYSELIRLASDLQYTLKMLPENLSLICQTLRSIFKERFLLKQNVV